MTQTSGSNSVRILKIIGYLVFLFILGESAARTFWSVRYDRGFLSTKPLVHAIYPRLNQNFSTIQPNDEAFDVLLLGASVLYPSITTVQTELRDQLTQHSDRRVNIHNVAVPGHTTLDSFYKYQTLADVPFDLVVVYHGINELRANNAPPEIFQSDYSHFSWYGFLNDDHRRNDAQWSLLPETVVWVGLKVREIFGSETVGRGRSRDDWLQYGANFKTVPSFRSNLNSLVDLAESAGTPILLMTLAHYLAPDYTAERFQNRQLDYLLFETPTEIWGTPKTVDAGIDAHNGVIPEIARARSTLFVDQEAAIPDGREYYNDICHFTGKGSSIFVANTLPVILPLMTR